MLRIDTDITTLLTELRQPLDAIQRRDADLARQLRRASTSLLLNVAEGSGHRGGLRRQRYRTALGSALEVLACVDAGEALGYHAALGDDARRRLDKIVRTLVSLTR